MTAFAEVVSLFAITKQSIMAAKKKAAANKVKGGFLVFLRAGVIIRTISRNTTAMILLIPVMTTGCHVNSLIVNPAVLIKTAVPRTAI